MEIHILGRLAAEKRMTEEKLIKPELVIGILDSRGYKDCPNNLPIVPVADQLRVDYLTYTFDDFQEESVGHVLINRDIAGKIVGDFSLFKGRIESLVVHCKAGLSRSPAVTAALNDSFSLGCSSEDFFSKRYTPNRTVFITIFRAAKEMGICKEYFWR